MCATSALGFKLAATPFHRRRWVQLRGALRAAVLPVSVPALLKALDLPSNVQAAMPVGSLVEELRAAGQLQVRLQAMACAVS